MPQRDCSSVRAEFDAALTAATAAIGIELDAAQRGLMFAHYERVIEANRRFNLTRITSPAEAAVKHHADSLTVLAMPGMSAAEPHAVLDVGTGAGFPAVPLAILRPTWRITAIDGTAKKVRFVAETAAALGLANIEARHARAADLRRDAQRWRLILLRAVTQLAPGLRECAPLLASGGRIVFYKTPHMDPREIREGSAAAGKLKLREEPPVDLALPIPEGTPLARRLICFAKT